MRVAVYLRHIRVRTKLIDTLTAPIEAPDGTLNIVARFPSQPEVEVGLGEIPPLRGSAPPALASTAHSGAINKPTLISTG